MLASDPEPVMARPPKAPAVVRGFQDADDVGTLALEELRPSAAEGLMAAGSGCSPVSSIWIRPSEQAAEVAEKASVGTSPRSSTDHPRLALPVEVAAGWGAHR